MARLYSDADRNNRKYKEKPEFRADKVEYQRRRRIDDAVRIKTLESDWYDANRERLNTLKRKRRALCHGGLPPNSAKKVQQSNGEIKQL